MAVCEYVKAGGIDPSRLQQTSPYGAGGPGIIAGSQRNSWIDTGSRGSVTELAVNEVDSTASSPGYQRVDFPKANLFSIIGILPYRNALKSSSPLLA